MILTGDLTKDFTRLYHDSSVWMDTLWKGVKVNKYVSDLWTYQEIIWETRPELIIETGSGCGGSALYFADMMARYGTPKVISIDTGTGYTPWLGLQFIQGNSIDPEIVATVRMMAGGCRTMVVLDSDHLAAHVLAEMEAYGPLVSPGCYLCVEDTIAAEMMPQLGCNPMDAVERFLLQHPEFESDPKRQKFLFTSNPKGFLLRSE